MTGSGITARVRFRIKNDGITRRTCGRLWVKVCVTRFLFAIYGGLAFPLRIRLLPSTGSGTDAGYG